MTKPGDGKTFPKKGDMLTMHYTGKLTSGAKFDSSLDRGTPFSFQIGVGQVELPNELRGYQTQLSAVVAKP